MTLARESATLVLVRGSTHDPAGGVPAPGAPGAPGPGLTPRGEAAERYRVS